MSLPPPPPSADAQPVDLGDPTDRRYDIDALRGVAMLLGIVLHAAIPFVPYYGADDTGGKLLFGLFEYIHLWRMPLFFLISGYFTSMLWRRRGLRALVRHRLRRIAAPLAVFYVPVIVLLFAGIVAGYVIADVKAEDTFGQADAYEAPQSDADQRGDEAAEDDRFGFWHLWFLWHLLWLVVAFALLASAHAWWAARGSRGPPAAFAWVLVPLSVVPFLGMQEDVLGPDTSDHILPAPAVIGFYAAFFFFGAAQYNEGDGGDPIDRTRQMVAGTVDRQPHRVRDPCRGRPRHRQRVPRGRCGMDGELWNGWRSETDLPILLPSALAVGFLLLDVSDASSAGVCAPGCGGGARTPIDPCVRCRRSDHGRHPRSQLPLPRAFHCDRSAAQRTAVPG